MSNETPEQLPEFSQAEVIEELWNRGELRWKLHPVQLKMWETIHNSKEDTIVIGCARRLGKTFFMCILAIEQCLKVPKSIVKFISPKQKQVKRNIKPLMQQIIADCPKDIKPDFMTNDNVWVFPNGSEIQLAGTDNGSYESLRGGYSHLCIVDEAGFCDDLLEVVSSVLQPTTDTTGGKVILVSTPSISLDHDFIEQYWKPFAEEDRLIKYTIYDNPMLGAIQLEKIFKRYPGREKNVRFRREYLCELIGDEDRAVVPEFTPDIQSLVVREWDRPPFFDTYVSMDIGFKDLTVALFGYYDFKAGKMIIEDELVMSGPTMTTNRLAEAIKEKERMLWTSPIGDFKKPVIRVSDNNLILINDLSVLHGLHFTPTAKDQAEAALNNMRIYISQQKIIINPRCKTLIKHLKGAVWNKKRTDYERSSDMGHYDAVDALSYLMRNISWSKNPYPANYGVGSDWFVNEKIINNQSHLEPYKKIFNIKH
jgi:hypothetical protein